MNILEYIEDLMDRGYSEEDASVCAYYQYSDTWDEFFNDDAWDYGDE